MKRILLMGIIATSGMTLFSYILSRVFKEKLLETELLNQLVFPNNKIKKKNNPAGFVIHYAVGIFFALFYHRLWLKSSQTAGTSTSSALGFMNGIIGISGWHLTLVLHPSPPKIDLVKYYLQLLIAHVLFGCLNGWVFRKSMNGQITQNSYNTPVCINK